MKGTRSAQGPLASMRPFQVKKGKVLDTDRSKLGNIRYIFSTLSCLMGKLRKVILHHNYIVGRFVGYILEYPATIA